MGRQETPLSPSIFSMASLGRPSIASWDTCPAISEDRVTVAHLPDAPCQRFGERLLMHKLG